ncbi:thioesterase [Streptomyces sp. tea 10]|nr:thioesterase [Streptomyces sp. tea 10]
MSDSTAAGRPLSGRELVRPWPRPAAHTVLYCFPHAGGAASAYRDWPDALPDWMEVVAVQLPGREQRVAESPCVDPARVAAAVRADAVRHARPYAVFGHSMGALLGFEVARLLYADDGLRAPALLAVSGLDHPATERIRPALSRLPESELVDWIAGLGGSPAQALAHPQLLELLLPALRADLRWLEDHTYRPGPRLPCPVSAFAGERDDRVTLPGLEAWARETTETATVRCYPGGHFCTVEQLPALAHDLASDLAEALDTAEAVR